MTNQDVPRCVDCGAQDVALDEDGVCNPCHIDRDLDKAREQLQQSEDVLSRRRLDVWE